MSSCHQFRFVCVILIIRGLLLRIVIIRIVFKRVPIQMQWWTTRFCCFCNCLFAHRNDMAIRCFVWTYTWNVFFFFDSDASFRQNAQMKNFLTYSNELSILLIGVTGNHVWMYQVDDFLEMDSDLETLAAGMYVSLKLQKTFQIKFRRTFISEKKINQVECATVPCPKPLEAFVVAWKAHANGVDCHERWHILPTVVLKNIFSKWL